MDEGMHAWPHAYMATCMGEVIAVVNSVIYMKTVASGLPLKLAGGLVVAGVLPLKT
jgi:hypothetical protein